MFKRNFANFHCGLAMVGPQTYYSFLLDLSLAQALMINFMLFHKTMYVKNHLFSYYTKDMLSKNHLI